MCWSTSLWTSLTEMSRLTHFVGQLFSRSQLVRVYSMLWLVLRSGGSPDTLCGLRPRRQVLVFGCNAKVNGKESSEQNVTSHLCSLMRPIGGHDTSASEKQQVTQNKWHLFFFFAGRVFVIYLFPFSLKILLYLCSSICLLRCRVMFMFTLRKVSYKERSVDLRRGVTLERASFLQPHAVASQPSHHGEQPKAGCLASR